MDKEIRALKYRGDVFYPATTTDAIAHPQTKVSLSRLINRYNVSVIWPLTDNNYSLDTAIDILDTKLISEQKIPGVIVEFINSSGKYEEWEFSGEAAFNELQGWRQIDSSTLLELQNQVFPVTVGLNASKTLIATGSTGESVSFDWHVYRKGLDVVSLATKTFNGTSTEDISTIITVQSNTYTTKNYTFTATYQGLTSSITKSIVVVDPYYYGVVNDGSSPVITSFPNSISSSKSFTWSSINLTNQKCCYAYPQYLGELSSIKDANNFEYIGSYTKTTTTVNGVAYYIYTLTKAITITGFKQIFS